jgi:uncharacterized protein (TIGR02466 family)
MKNYDILLFPETISVYNLNIEKIKLKKFLNNLNFLKSNLKNKNISISEEINILDNFHELKNMILNCCDDYLNNKFKLNVKFKIVDSWAVLTKKNGSSHKHLHCHSFLSGAFYPLVEEKTEIKFHRKYQNDFWNVIPKEYNINNSDNWTIKVNNNDLILFKSYLEHEIVKYNGENNRYSISFNVIPIGNLGEKTGKLFIQ